MKAKNTTNLTAFIRNLICHLPPSELATMKPSRIFPELEKNGFEVTSSVRTITSKILGEWRQKLKEKKAAEGHEVTKMSNEEVARILTLLRKRSELAAQLLETCDGDFEIASNELERLRPKQKVSSSTQK